MLDYVFKAVSNNINIIEFGGMGGDQFGGMGGDQFGGMGQEDSDDDE